MRHVRPVACRRPTDPTGVCWTGHMNVTRSVFLSLIEEPKIIEKEKELGLFY